MMRPKPKRSVPLVLVTFVASLAITSQNQSSSAATGSAGLRVLQAAAGRLTLTYQLSHDPAARHALARQLSDVARATEVLQIAGQTDPIKRARLITASTSRYQVAWLEGRTGPSSPTLELPAVPPTPSRPSEAARVLLARLNVTATSEQTRRLDLLDTLPPPAQRGLGRVFEAFLAFHHAAVAAYGNLPRPVADPVSGTALDRAVITARQVLLDASLDLIDVPTPPSEAGTCDPIVVPPALAIDLDGCDSTYVDDVILSIDVGGNDLYMNNAGANFDLTQVCIWACLRAGQAAALIDLSGNDRYEGRFNNANGSGSGGAGFLLDVRGEDVYTLQPPPGGRVPGSANGSSAGLGHGFLVDLEGNDIYAHPRVLHGGANGGARGGGDMALGRLDRCSTSPETTPTPQRASTQPINRAGA